MRSARARAVEDVIMRRQTTALALAGTLLAAPAAAYAADSLEAPIAGHPTVADQMRAERSLNLRRDLTALAVRLAKRQDISGAHERRRLRGAPTGEIRARIRELRRRLQVPPAPAALPVLEAIAACESGGDPKTDTGNGFYGKYQFTLETWAAVGGTGNPADASEAEQDSRAAILYEQAGPSPWPVCGQ
jgi:Transglycosylase-like domain